MTDEQILDEKELARLEREEPWDRAGVERERWTQLVAYATERHVRAMTRLLDINGGARRADPYELRRIHEQANAAVRDDFAVTFGEPEACARMWQRARRFQWVRPWETDTWHAATRIGDFDVAVTLCGRALELGGNAEQRPTQPVREVCDGWAELARRAR